MQSIPFIDLNKQYESIRLELDQVLSRLFTRGNFILGEEVSAFEREFADYCKISHSIGVASGTEALQLALLACDIGRGDDIIVPAHTAVATIAAIHAAGANPLLVDVDPNRYTLDPALLARACTPRTRAIIPVHLYGCPADLLPILQFARKQDILVVEDCAQAHGAVYQGRKVGSWGDLAAFSFYPTKNLGGFGDGGAVLTGDPARAEKVRLLRQYGWAEHYISSVRGINSRLDELQAAILRVKLKYLDEWNATRGKLAGLYYELLSGTELTLPAQPGDSSHVFHQFVVRHPRRDALREHLKDLGIQTLVHYPVPIHLQPAYADLGRPAGSLPVAERISREVLSLPLYPELTEGNVVRISRAITDFFNRKTR